MSRVAALMIGVGGSSLLVFNDAGKDIETDGMGTAVTIIAALSGLICVDVRFFTHN